MFFKLRPKLSSVFCYFCVLICRVAYSRAALGPLRRSWQDVCQCTGRIKQTKEQKEKSFQHIQKKKQKETSPDTGSALYPSNLLCSQLPAPAIRRGATGGHIGAIFAPMAPFLATAFKVLHCNVHGLDVCLVPYMQSYHYPCLLTIAGPVFVTSVALCLGLWHDCTVDLFSFTYCSLCLSFSVFLYSDCVPRLNPTLIWQLVKSFTSQPVWHLCCFDLFGSFPDNSHYSRAKMSIDVRQTLARRFALCASVFHTISKGISDNNNPDWKGHKSRKDKSKKKGILSVTSNQPRTEHMRNSVLKAIFENSHKLSNNKYGTESAHNNNWTAFVNCEPANFCLWSCLLRIIWLTSTEETGDGEFLQRHTQMCVMHVIW